MFGYQDRHTTAILGMLTFLPALLTGAVVDMPAALTSAESFCTWQLLLRREG
jgi:hypothetical protein